ncbi:hypothetical protein ACFWPH_33505 [Nocardia sp. NPDC058499]|uniref:hypothetical protein n=1 Tax=Nocardia sp. NPDC058499 TaxID=3346530 RepID=UPI00364CDBE0
MTTATVAAASLPLAGSTTAAPAAITITVDADATGGRVLPEHFLGLSWEADQLHQSWIDDDTGSLAALMRNLGPGTTRYSANAVDNTAWHPDAPEGTTAPVITAADLARAGDLAHATGWSVDLGVNLGANDPAAAADEVRAAQQEFGPMLRSVQIGNQPDFFALSQLEPYDHQTYLQQVHAYRTAIDAAAEGIRFAGPDSAMTAGALPLGQAYEPYARTWRAAYLNAFAGQSDFLNQHYYPLVKTPGGNTAAIVDQLTSRAIADADRAYIEDLVNEAAAAGVEPHLSETNSVAGGGQAGVSNTFGAALWTVDYLLTAASSGIAGVNMHQQPHDCGSYTWVCFPDGSATLHAQPAYYAGLLVSQLRGGTFLPTEVSDPNANISAHALRMPDGHIKVVVENAGPGPQPAVDVRVEGSTTTTATAQWLTAPSPYATSDVRFADSRVGADGSFTPGPARQLSTESGAVAIDFVAPSAVLLNLTD